MIEKVRTRSTGLAGVTNLSVLAPLRDGMVPGIEPISYVGRLRKVLDALHTSRQNLRESELLQIFPDVVGRFGIIHTFRYALVAPQAGPAGLPAEFGTWRLSLNVTFDGGWEPYMRVIKDDIGPLLDLLFCHSPDGDYPGSEHSSFEEYCNWVRKYEVPAGLFFADSAGTVDDSHYLARAEKLQRDGASDDALARQQLPSMREKREEALAAAWKDPERALALPLRTLKGLYRLATYFQPYAHGPVLLRFAQHALNGPIEFMNQIERRTQAPSLPPDLEALKRKWAAIKDRLLRDELDWLQWKQPVKLPTVPRVIASTEKLQSHVLGVGERMTHGCLILLQVKNPALALAHIKLLADRCGPVAPGGIGYLVGFTYPGLEALGVTPDHLSKLPQEFLEGMEARAALLGDVRTNHPDRWNRPTLHGQTSGQRVDFRSVHLLVQVRLADKDSTELKHPLLAAEVAPLDRPETGLRVLATDWLRSYRDEKGFHSVGHMGIADGVSQPGLPTAVNEYAYYDDQVSAGELLLGYANDRGDKAPKEPDPFLHTGTFLAVRKLLQFMNRLDALAPVSTPQGKDLLEKMVGRAADGMPLHGLPADHQHGNDFRFDTQTASDACPFHSHIRRLNPRDGRNYTPRILRRGMSWGLRSETERNEPRGVMFMAYCASLSEQFETLQRWVAGGNASGVGSAQGDPLLRVPKEGERYTFRYLSNGKVQRVELPTEPLVQVQWGLYAFVPSLDALKNLAQFTVAAAATPPAPPPPPPSQLETIRALLEDRTKSKQVWEWVRNGSAQAPQNGAYGHLVGDLPTVLSVLRDDGTTYSVQGYGNRMQGSIGLNLLGMDPSHPRYSDELPVNAVIAAVTEEEAFDAALEHAKDFLAELMPIPSGPGDVVRLPVDLVDFSDRVISRLCTDWFGLPDGSHLLGDGYQPGPPTVPRCPGSFGPSSRYMFMPHPDPQFAADGQAHAKAVRDAVGTWLSGNPDLTQHRLSAEIQAVLSGMQSQQHLADNIAGTMLGFAPSVQSNFLRAIDTWLEEGGALWVHQQSLFEQSPADTLGYAQAKAALRAPLLAAMRKNPVPTMVWRTHVGNDPQVTGPARNVVLGLESALADPAAPDVLLFGRDHHDDAKNTTTHGCPGYAIAMGVMLALVASLMKAGTLRPTGSPVLLILTRTETESPAPPADTPAPRSRVRRRR